MEIRPSFSNIHFILFYMFLRSQAISDSIRSFVLYHLMYYKAALANGEGWGRSTNLMALHNATFLSQNVFVFIGIKK